MCQSVLGTRYLFAGTGKTKIGPIALVLFLIVVLYLYPSDPNYMMNI